jgi:sn1-specific diacylglycerol lipase
MISIAEQFVLAPIFLGEYITSTSLIAAHSSINILSVIIPGSSEASFSLASFINLVKREWREPAFGEHLPDKTFGVTQIAKALVAWVSLQGVTQEWQEKRWFEFLREIHVDAPRQFDSLRSRRGSRVRVTSDVIFPGHSGQIISADIGAAPTRAQSVISHSSGSHTERPPVAKRPRGELQLRPINADMKATLRRLSKMVLAGYGGASLLFFGISLTSNSPARASSTSKPKLGSPNTKHSEEAQLASAIDASEAEAAGELPPPDEVEYSWWDILLGKHDQEIFERFANPPTESHEKLKLPAAEAVIGIEHLMPRFWVLTDHSRAQIVLVLRGLQ